MRTSGGPVHPRMRGARDADLTIRPIARGTSPHARGKVALVARTGRGFRYIPACAGQGWQARPCDPSQTVHPRMRGARPKSVIGCSVSSGTSPHARGKGYDETQILPVVRYIPACAGQGARFRRKSILLPLYVVVGNGQRVLSRSRRPSGIIGKGRGRRPNAGPGGLDIEIQEARLQEGVRADPVAFRQST